MLRRLLVFTLAASALSAPSLAGGFVRPIDQPALTSALAVRSPLVAIGRAGDRVVAVGRRGHIVYSDDGGSHWRQAAVPVSVDLLGVSFPAPKVGWAVGHEGVVLATQDGGATWVKQLAGKQATQIAVRHYQGLDARTADETRALEQAQADLAADAVQPFLDVLFESESAGFVVGAFNTIFRTEDAGRTWVPWMDRTANPAQLHFNAVRGRQGHVFLVGEQGTVWRLDSGTKRFVPMRTPYAGTFFGAVVDGGGGVVAFGMRGSVYRSADRGRRWHRVTVNSVAGITGGVELPDGRIALVDQGGSVHVSRDGGRTFFTTRLTPPTPCYGVASGGDGVLVVAGAGGAFRVPAP